MREQNKTEKNSGSSFRSLLIAPSNDHLKSSLNCSKSRSTKEWYTPHTRVETAKQTRTDTNQLHTKTSMLLQTPRQFDDSLINHATRRHKWQWKFPTTMFDSTLIFEFSRSELQASSLTLTKWSSWAWRNWWITVNTMCSSPVLGQP